MQQASNHPPIATDEISAESERASSTAHFLRQSIIIRRREASWINRRWCQNRQFTTHQTPWTR